MSLVVVGSIAFDAVKTPFGERERMLGGSAVHFSLAACSSRDVRVVGPVGDDFGDDEYDVLRGRGVNTDDIEHVRGRQDLLLGGRVRVERQRPPHRSTRSSTCSATSSRSSRTASKQAEMLFLANIQPDLQREVREQCTGAKLAGLDSMNLWIETTRDSLVRTIGTVDLILMNDDEVRMLTEQPTLLRAARKIMELGPRVVVVKQGEYGAALFTEDGFFSLPAYPLETVIDPTGRGRLVRRRLLRLPRLPGRRDRRRDAAAGDDLRLGRRLLLGRGVRLRARRAAHPRGHRGALRGVPRDDLGRGSAGRIGRHLPDR